MVTGVSEVGGKNVDRKGVVGRYLAVSCINVLNHQVLLFIANSWWGWSGGWANVFAACVSAGPGYLLTRAWVWRVTGRHDLRGEVLPFWLIALAGLVMSTVFAEMADRVFGAGLAVNIASLFAYFLVWVAKFLLLDRLFRRSLEKQSATPDVQA